jgi:hypothetical protein
MYLQFVPFTPVMKPDGTQVDMQIVNTDEGMQM